MPAALAARTCVSALENGSCLSNGAQMERSPLGKGTAEAREERRGEEAAREDARRRGVLG